MQTKRKIIVYSLSFLMMNTLPLNAARHDPRLDKLNNQIASIKANINQDVNKRLQLQQELQKNEESSGKISTELQKTNQKLQQQQRLLASLKSSESTQQSILRNQQSVLGQQIRTAYLIGDTSYLKLILNQQDPSEIGRALIYAHALNASRIQTIDTLQNTLQQIQSNQQQIQQHSQVLSELENKQRTQRDSLVKVTKNRRQLIQTMNGTIKTKNQKLDQLITDKRRLELMLAELEKKSLSRMTGSTNFGKLKGRMPWPTKGNILNNFGTQIEQSELRWTGILIKAAPGQPVRAVANGKVVFAKWLSGYGLLLIISHGDGYMTLYGRNQDLYKKEGDTVSQGELVASAGKSGGFQIPGLYFAIRHNVQPLDPLSWFSK